MDIRRHAAALALVLATFAALPPAHAQQALSIDRSPVFDRNLSSDFLDEASAAGVNPGDRRRPIGAGDIIVGHYNDAEGLFAGYEASNGARLLSKVSPTGDGTLTVRVLYFNRSERQIKPLVTMGARDALNPMAGSTLLVGGVDVIQLMADARRPERRDHAAQGRFRQVARSAEGEALIEFVPVLYAQLEEFDEYADQAAGLKAPLGLIRMAFDLTGSPAGFRNANALLGDTRAVELRSNCQSPSCFMQGKQFVVHQNGLFDIMGGFGGLGSRGASQRSQGLFDLAPESRTPV